MSATHEADHRFTVEGFVCGADGKGSANIDVLVKDTKISYGQIVKTDGDGYYKAAFHLHNDNLGDPLLIEANGQQQQQKVSFDPKDLESERIILVNFGTGCMQDRGSPPLWVYLGSGTVAAAVRWVHRVQTDSFVAKAGTENEESLRVSGRNNRSGPWG